MSDVPCLKGRDKLVWKSVVWGDIQLTISGCVFSRRKVAGSYCGHAAPPPWRRLSALGKGWEQDAATQPLLQQGAELGSHIALIYCMEECLESGKFPKSEQRGSSVTMGAHRGASTTQRGSVRRKDTQRRGSWLCSHWDPAWLQGERPPAALQTSYKIWN